MVKQGTILNMTSYPMEMAPNIWKKQQFCSIHIRTKLL